jgi:3-deoxy-D-manno-octulosonic-acid transferase
MVSVRDILNQSEKHLNKLVSVGLTQVKSTEDVKTAVSKQGNFAYVG